MTIAGVSSRADHWPVAEASSARVGQGSRILGEYRLGEVLHRGRTAIAYAATEVRGGGAVTLTIFTLAIERVVPVFWLFAGEAPWCCFPSVLHAGSEAGESYIVTTASRGEPLEQVLLRDGPCSPSAAARLLLELCRDLAQADPEVLLHGALTTDALLFWRDEHGEPHISVLLSGLLDSLECASPADPRGELELLGWLLGKLAGQANIVAHPELAEALERALNPQAPDAFRDRDQLVQALTQLSRTRSGPVAALAPPRIDEDVQVTVFRPKALVERQWHRLLAFVHLAARRPNQLDAPDPVEKVRRIALAELAEDFTRYRMANEDTLLGLPEGGQIHLVPEVDGVEFNPPTRSFAWHEDVHQEAFAMRTEPGRAGQTLRGRLNVYLGTILLAEVGVAFKVTLAASAVEAEAADRGRNYRKIFASYSHADARIVRDFEAVAQSLGDDYLRDVRKLRSGEDWSDGLERLIEQADVFQLFWSKNSMYSPFCRREWEYALARGINIRPVYWETPLPANVAADLPPTALKALHFARFRGETPESSAPPTPNEAAEHEFAPAAGRRSWLPWSAGASSLLLLIGAGLRLSSGGASVGPSDHHAKGPEGGIGLPRPTVEASEDKLAARRSIRSGGGSKPSGSTPEACRCAPGDPLCGCFDSIEEPRGGGLALQGTSIGAGGQGRKEATCFVAGTANEPLYPQLSALPQPAPHCASWRSLATYRPSDLVPHARERALERACSSILLYACEGGRATMVAE